jgi:hypothetical protein
MSQLLIPSATFYSQSDEASDLPGFFGPFIAGDLVLLNRYGFQDHFEG